MSKFRQGCILLVLALLAGCAGNGVEQAVYEGMRERDRATRPPDGMPPAEPAPDYRDYRKARDQTGTDSTGGQP